MQYVTFDFLALSKNGSNTNFLTIGGLAAQALYAAQSDAQSLLYDFLVHSKAKTLVSTPSCPALVQAWTSLDLSEVALFCNGTDSLEEFSSARPILGVCLSPGGPDWQARERAGIRAQELVSFCAGLGPVLDQAESYLDSVYNCEMSPYGRCTSLEIALLQWASSRITASPLPEIALPASTTLHDWFEDIPAFEYSHFCKTLLPGCE